MRKFGIMRWLSALSVIIFVLVGTMVGIRHTAMGAEFWAATYGGISSDEGAFIQQTTDGGYIMVGTTDSFGAGSADFWILKLDNSGRITWQKTYDTTGSDEAFCIKQTTDGGYIVGGFTSPGEGYYDLLILKLTSTGDVTWQKTYGTARLDFIGETFNSIQQTSDGGYIVLGDTPGDVDLWVLKLDSTGNVSWQKTYGGPNGDSGESLYQTGDGGYIVLGKTASFSAGANDVWLLKLDSSGGVTWQKSYGGDGEEDVTAFYQTNDGGYIVAGPTESFGAGDRDVWIVKLDSVGDVTWQKTYGGISGESALSVYQMSDGNYIVGGYTGSFGAGSADTWVFKLDSTGGIIWQKTYGGAGDDAAFSLQKTTNDGYILTGLTTFFGAGDSDVLVFAIDSNGNIPGCALQGVSNAQITTTNVVEVDSTATVNDTNVTITTPSVSVTNTSVTPNYICGESSFMLWTK